MTHFFGPPSCSWNCQSYRQFFYWILRFTLKTVWLRVLFHWSWASCSFISQVICNNILYFEGVRFQQCQLFSLLLWAVSYWWPAEFSRNKNQTFICSEKACRVWTPIICWNLLRLIKMKEFSSFVRDASEEFTSWMKNLFTQKKLFLFFY